MLFRRGMGEKGASDVAGTVLLVLAAVVLGSILTVIVTTQLSEPSQQSAATFAVGPTEANDAFVDVTLTNGESIDASTLRITVERNGTGAADVPSATWDQSDFASPGTMRAGETLTFPVAPAIQPDETIVVRIYRTDLNVIAAALTTRSGFPITPLPPVSGIALSFTPSSIPADGVAAAVARVTMSHPDGLLAISKVVVKRGNDSRLGVTLHDDGIDGDAAGGDGIWSGLVRFPTDAVTDPLNPLNYNFWATVTDASGREWHSQAQTLQALYPTVSIIGGSSSNGTSGGGGTNGTSSTGLAGNFSGNSSGNFAGNSSGNFSGNGSGNFSGAFDGNSSGQFGGNGTGNFSGNFTGDLDGAFIGLGAGKRATEGTRFKGPTSTNVTRFSLVNWSYDRLAPSELDSDAMLIHVVAGNQTWSAYLKFDYSTVVPKNVPKITHMRIWNSVNETWYKANGNLSLDTFTLDLLNINSANWTQLANNQIPDGTYINATNSPNASYPYSNIQDNPFLVIAFMRDEQATGQGAKSLDKGIFTVDVEFI